MKNSSQRTFILLLISAVFHLSANAKNGDWPKVIQNEKGKIVIYQPTPEELNGDHLKGRAAFSVTAKDSKTPVFGALWSVARISTDREKRIVYLLDAKITDIRFPEQTDTTKIEALKKMIEDEVPKWALEISLDELLTSIEQNNPSQAADIKTDAPEIIYKDHYSILIVLDGEPKTSKLENTEYNRVVNTPYFMLQDPKNQVYYLYGDKVWFSAKDLSGKWTLDQKAPKDLKKIQDWIEEERKKNNTGMDTSTSKSASLGTPEIIVLTKPSELIQTTGEPQFAAIDGTQLLYVKNSENDIFKSISDQQYYILLSGRWYKSTTISGSWNYVASDKLPEDFARIPEGSDKDAVLASVAGTSAAREAVLDAQIPQTAAVDRKEAKCEVKYDGDPQFKEIEGTRLYYAINTSSSVIKDGGTYYVCQNGVWFTGSSPNGPWAVATSVPDDVQKIPASNPVHNTKYVYIYESTPEVVYVGYTPGYTGCYIYGPTVVYGTGWYYPGWYGAYYYPRPVTYGFGVHYNPWTGWGMSFSMSFGWGGYYGGYGGWWGPCYRPPYYYRPPYGGYYGPHGGHYGNTNININNNYNINRPQNIYNNNSGVRPSQPIAGGSGNRPGGGTAGSGTRPGGGASTLPANPNQKVPGGGTRPSTGDYKVPQGSKDMKNNVYTDKNGNVYRNNGSNWQQNNGKDWKNVSTPSSKPSTSPSTRPATQPSKTPSTRPSTGQPSYNQNDLNRQQMDRSRGQTRSNNYNNYNRSGTTAPRSGGSMPRSGSSMPRGGGGRR